MRPSRIISFLAVLVFAISPVRSAEWDVIIYGGTSAAVTAAIQAAKMGKTVVVVSPDKHLGGLSSGGLGWTDTGNKAVIGGLSREFYHRIWKHYQSPSSWRQQKQEEYGNKGQGTPAIDGEQRTMWIFEPSAAEGVFDRWISEYEITVVREAWLDRGTGGVTLQKNRITRIRTLDGNEFTGKMFIDATYEGDLLAAAGISYHVGREGREVYGEDWNGVQTGVLHHRHHFDAIPEKRRIDPYVTRGDPSSGVLPRISPHPPGEKHQGDHRVQAYCFRMCLTNDPSNRIPFLKPKRYDPSQYELLVRIFEAGWRDVFHKFDPIPNHKTDTNNHGPFSTDNIGMNYRYPDASYEERKAIIAEHENYQKGWLYFIANDPRVPKEIQEKMRTWGLPKDEFTDNGNWSHQLYIREARRMIGHYVMTENELLQRRPTPQSVGMGSYTIDSHNVQRYITPQGYAQNEGDIGVKCKPYQIAYGSLIPKREECENLLVPVCVSSSHIAFGSIRMEPVFMILGQSAATAAVQAIEEGQSVQEIDYQKLKERLGRDGQVLSYEVTHSGNGIDPAKLPGIVIDDAKAVFAGFWKESGSSPKYLGAGYRHDNKGADPSSTATFEVALPNPGKYVVRFGYTPNSNRASNVPIQITHKNGTAEVLVNEKKTPPMVDLFIGLGTYEFGDSAKVTITNRNADGYVVVDGLQLIPEGN